MPQNRHNRSTTHVWAILGAILAFVLSVAIPSIVIGSMKLLPTHSERSITSAPSPATLFDANSDCPDGAPRSCFIIDTSAQLTREQNVEPTDNEEDVSVTVTERIARTDTDHTIISIDDHLKIIRDSTFPVLDPVSTLSVSAPEFGMNLETGNFTRDGLQYFFPFETEKRSYDYFDAFAQRTIPLDFVEEKDKTYVFTQTISPENLVDSATRSYTHPDDISDEPTGEPLQSDLTEAQRSTLRDLLVSAPASQFYPNGTSVTGSAVSGTVVLKPYYTATRFLTVDPNSGIILDQSEDIFLYLAQDDEEAQATAEAFSQDRSILASDNDVRSRTLIQTKLRWDESTKQHAQDAAAPTNSTLAMLRIIAFICQIIGLSLLIYGLWRYNSIRKA